jgi:hypothetical protein
METGYQIPLPCPKKARSRYRMYNVSCEHIRTNHRQEFYRRFWIWGFEDCEVFAMGAGEMFSVAQTSLFLVLWSDFSGCLSCPRPNRGKDMMWREESKREYGSRELINQMRCRGSWQSIGCSGNNWTGLLQGSRIWAWSPISRSRCPFNVLVWMTGRSVEQAGKQM